MKRSAPPRKIGAKKLAALGGRVPRSTITAKPKPLTRTPLKRSQKPIKAKASTRERNRQLTTAGSSRRDDPQTQATVLRAVVDYQCFIRRLPCCITGAEVGVEVAHLKGRGAWGGDFGNCVPLHRQLHRTGPKALHLIGQRAFEALHSVDLNQLALGYLAHYQTRTGGTP